jgi:RNA polymerase sigma factor (sigma-70 family)
VSTDDDFMAYVGTHWSPLVRSALLLDGAERAEDVVQEALVRSYQHWGSVWRDDRADVDVLTHLLAGIYGPVARSWRGENASADGASDADDDTAADVPADTPELVRALHPLSPLHRDVLVLTYVAELSEAQIAEVLDVHPETVRERLEQALAAVEPQLLRDDVR